jgi:hypothetical protein
MAPSEPSRLRLNLDILDHIAGFVGDAMTNNILNTSYAIWSRYGQGRQVFVNADNIKDILKNLSDVALLPHRQRDTLQDATFVIRAFDGSGVVATHFRGMCNYVSKLKIIFCLPGWCAVDFAMFRNTCDACQRKMDYIMANTDLSFRNRENALRLFTDVVVKTLGILENAPHLVTLNLNFVPANFAPMSIDGLNALSRLRYAPVLETLHINLDGHVVPEVGVIALAQLKHSQTLHTIILNLDNNSRFGKSGASALGELGQAPALRSLSLYLKNTHIYDHELQNMSNALMNSRTLEKVYLGMGGGVTIGAHPEITKPLLHWSG